MPSNCLTSSFRRKISWSKFASLVCLSYNCRLMWASRARSLRPRERELGGANRRAARQLHMLSITADVPSFVQAATKAAKPHSNSVRMPTARMVVV